MIYCGYCGTKNRDDDFRCSQCNKYLSLMPNNYSSRPNSKSTSSSNLNDPYSYYHNQNHPIKNKYLEKDLNPNEFLENNPQNQRINNQNINQSNQSRYNPNMRNQQYQNYEKPQNHPMNQHEPHERQNYSQNIGKYQEVDKTAVEWDVVIATVLLVIILTAILQRIFPFTAIFISLLIGLDYILIATKSKFSLFKSIPLAILTILAISAYFSI